MWLPLLISLVTLAATATDRHSRTIPLPAGRTLAIDITVGNVRLEGSDRPDVEIEIERRAPSTEDLSRVPIAIDESPTRVLVRVVQAAGATDPAVRADVVVRVPRDAVVERVQILEGRLIVNGFRGTLSADVRRGPIDATDVSGSLRLETGIGSIAMTNARLSPNGVLRLRAFNGDVRLALAERPVDVRILALALNGRVQSDIPLTMKDTWGPRWGEVTLGKGEPVISIDVVTGTIEIRTAR